MAYSYSQEKPWLFTDEGSRAFLKFRDKALHHLRVTGAFTLGRAMNWVDGVGDSFKMIACVDRLVELGEIRAIEMGRASSQDQVYTEAR